MAFMVNPLNTQSPKSSKTTDDQPTSSAVSDVLVNKTSPRLTPYFSISDEVHSTRAVKIFFFKNLLL